MNLKKMTPLQGTAKPFHEQVRELERPYIKISEAEWEELLEGPSDFYRLADGRVVTFGNADGGYALMPLNAQAAAALLEAQH